MLKRIVSLTIILSLVFGGLALAADEPQTQDTGTIVGADQLVNNRYQYVDPQDKDTQPPAPVKKLLDQGVFTAVEDARNTQTVTPSGN